MIDNITSSTDLRNSLKDMVDAIETITYSSWRGTKRIYVSRDADSDCTRSVKPALEKARKLLEK